MFPIDDSKAVREIPPMMKALSNALPGLLGRLRHEFLHQALEDGLSHFRDNPPNSCCTYSVAEGNGLESHQ